MTEDMRVRRIFPRVEGLTNLKLSIIYEKKVLTNLFIITKSICPNVLILKGGSEYYPLLEMTQRGEMGNSSLNHPAVRY